MVYSSTFFMYIFYIFCFRNNLLLIFVYRDSCWLIWMINVCIKLTLLYLMIMSDN